MSICSNFQLTYSRNNKVSSLSKKKSECDGNECSSDISLQVGVSCDVIFTVGEKKKTNYLVFKVVMWDFNDLGSVSAAATVIREKVI